MPNDVTSEKRDVSHDAISLEGDDDDVTKKGFRVWRVYPEDGYTVRSMTREDALLILDYKQRFYGTLSRCAIETVLDCFPAGEPGLYVGEWKGEVVASSVYIPWGENVVYGTSYFVPEQRRGKGFGTRLRDEVSLDHLAGRTLCIDASAMTAEKNKSKFGHVTTGHNMFRYRGTATARPDIIATIMRDNSFDILPIDEVGTDTLLSYDDDNFVSRGFPFRHQFLRKWTHLPRGATYVARDLVSGRVIGYGCRRPCIAEGEHGVGPLYADRPAVAEVLMARLCEGVQGQTILIDLCDSNPAAVALAEKFNMRIHFKSERQYLNGTIDDPPNMFAMTCCEICGY